MQEIGFKILCFQNNTLLCQGAFRLLLNMWSAVETEDLYINLKHQHRLSQADVRGGRRLIMLYL